MREAVRNETRAAYRVAILEAAARVFGRLGFHAAKMADIAAEAGVAAGTVYNYFKNKEEVFRSIVVHGHDKAYQQMLANSGIADPLERLKTWTRDGLAFLEENGVLFSIFIRLGGTTDFVQQRAVESLHEQAYARFNALTIAALSEAAAQGLVRKDIPPSDLALLLDGYNDAVIFAWARAGCPPGGLAAKADLVLDLFLRGAKPP